jgi:hypothetical protein
MLLPIVKLGEKDGFLVYLSGVPKYKIGKRLFGTRPNKSCYPIQWPNPQNMGELLHTLHVDMFVGLFPTNACVQLPNDGFFIYSDQIKGA